MSLRMCMCVHIYLCFNCHVGLHLRAYVHLVRVSVVGEAAPHSAFSLNDGLTQPMTQSASAIMNRNADVQVPLPENPDILVSVSSVRQELHPTLP
jgi:hypothetical protein